MRKTQGQRDKEKLRFAQAVGEKLSDKVPSKFQCGIFMKDNDGL